MKPLLIFYIEWAVSIICVFLALTTYAIHTAGGSILWPVVFGAIALHALWVASRMIPQKELTAAYVVVAVEALVFWATDRPVYSNLLLILSTTTTLLVVPVALGILGGRLTGRATFASTVTLRIAPLICIWLFARDWARAPERFPSLESGVWPFLQFGLIGLIGVILFLAVQFAVSLVAGWLTCRFARRGERT